MKNKKFKFAKTDFCIKELTYENDLTSLIDFLNANQDYFTDYQLTPATANDTEEFFYDVPEGVSLTHKTLLGVFADAQLVGMIDLLANYPEPKKLIIGYLVLIPTYRGIGLAQALYHLIEDFAIAQEMNVLRLGVIKANRPAVHFWQKQGFVELNSYPTDYGEQMTMEKL